MKEVAVFECKSAPGKNRCDYENNIKSNLEEQAVKMLLHLFG
jgi:hypothetical protein